MNDLLTTIDNLLKSGHVLTITISPPYANEQNNKCVALDYEWRADNGIYGDYDEMEEIVLRSNKDYRYRQLDYGPVHASYSEAYKTYDRMHKTIEFEI